MKYLINGDFLCRSITGIERFALEVCTRLDKMVQQDFLAILIPANAKFVPEFNNIKVIKSSVECNFFPKWVQGEFNKQARKQKMIPLCLGNTCPIFNPGIVVVHDIYAKDFSKDFVSFRDKLVCFLDKLMYKRAAKKAIQIVTVSEFTKDRIISVYKTPPEKIKVIPNGWEHFKTVEADTSILKNFPELNGEFYFTLGSLSKRKNLKWIAEYAKKHPKDIFAISGKAISGLVPEELKCLQTLPNVSLLGYVSDGQVKALMEHCKAFVFPSYYEGFGIPPLEALSVGARIIVAKAASLPEIYGNSAVYIDAENTDVNLSVLLEQPVEAAEPVLKKYTYENAAKDLYKVLEEVAQIQGNN